MKIVRITILILTLSVVAGCASVGTSNFKLRKYKEVALSNGMKVLLVSDKKLPSFSLVTMIKTGSASDPHSKFGLANFVGGMLEQGAGGKSATELADSLGQIGADFGVSVSSDYTMISGSSLSFHSDQLLDDYSKMLISPTFKNSEIKRRKKQVVSILKRRVDSPGSFANMAFTKYLYASHPYGHSSIGTPKGVQSIKRKDVIRFYKRFYRPNNVVMAVVGDFEDDIVSKLEARFGSWGAREIKLVKFSETTKIDGKRISLVHKKGLKQSQVLVGHLGIKRSNPDYVKLKIANTILGRGFTSRLMQEIRVKRGLTYSIRSYFVPKSDRGPFVISTSSRHEKIHETISETLNVYKTFRENGVSKEEVVAAKSYLKGVFPRILETASSTAENLLILRYYGISDSYLETFLDQVDRISVSDVNKAIKKHFDPDNLKILVFSNKYKVQKALTKVAPMEVKDYSEIF